ncbi:MAG: nuclear transport factor 2 family protein [Lapillicoccus sp.]
MDSRVALEPETGSGAPADPQTSDEADEEALEELLGRVAQWDQAIRDRDEPLARQLLHPGFALELVQPVRSVMRHDVWLEVLSDYVVHEWEVEDQLVDLDGDYAALLQRVRMRATVMGEDRSGIFVVSDLWRRVGGEWVVWRRHSTPFSAGRIGAEPSR